MESEKKPQIVAKPRLTVGPVLLCDHVTADSAEVVGSKAARLASLRETVSSIPPWYVITAAAFEKELRDAELQELLGELMQYDTGDARWFRASREVHQRVLGITFSPELRQALLTAHDELLSPNAWVAVRASACPPMKSGLCKSYLFLRRRSEIDAFILRVWASAFTPEAVTWRRRQHLPPARPHLAVIVQQMVEAESSGVIYTAHPESGDPRQMIIRSLFGNGKALGDPKFPTDTFVIDKEEMEITSTLALKTSKLVMDEAENGLREVPIERIEQGNCSLRADDVLDLARLGSLVENHFGRPQTVSFGVDGQGALAILEVVDMGDVREYGPAAGNTCQWDTAELFADRPGRQTPLQFSVFRRITELAAQSFAHAVGVSPAVMAHQRRALADMRGRVHGHLYANLDVCRHFLDLCAEAEADAESIAASLGLNILSSMQGSGSTTPTTAVDLWTVMRTPLQLAAMTEEAATFHGQVRERLAQWRSLSLRLLPPARLLSMLYQIEDELLGSWDPSWMNDYHAVCGVRQVELMVRELINGSTGTTHWHLLLSDAPGASVRAALDLMELAEMFRKSVSLRHTLLTIPPHEWYEALATDPDGQTGFAAIRAWIGRHGHLPTAGYGPGGVPWRRHPAGLARLLREYVKRLEDDRIDPSSLQSRRLQRRKAAEDAFASSLSGAWLTRPRAALQRTYVDSVRQAIACRWDGWMLLHEVWNLMRDVLDALGHCLANEALLPSAAGVTYLTMEEVKALFNGSAATTDLEGLIELRRREANAVEHSPPPTDRAFYTYGIVHHRNRFASPAPDTQGSTLHGVGCEPGIVTGRVRWMNSPLDIMPEEGEIIAMEALDPGWAPVLPLAAGILVQRGHAFSAVAAMARELGIPTIVSIRQLSRQRIHGVDVTLDGASGTVSLKDSQDAAAPQPGNGG